MYRLSILALALLATTGCVGKAKYDASLADAGDLRNQLAAANQSMIDMQGEKDATIAALRNEKAAVQAKLDEAYGQLARKVAETGALKSDVAEMEEALRELEARRARAEANLQSYRDLVARFQAMIDAGTLKVKVMDGRMIVELATDILFPPGGASLSKEGQTAVSEVAAVLASIPDREYQIAGHTDDDAISTERFPSNWHLGSARAIAVTNLLIKSGLGSDRVSAASYAEHRPVDTNRTDEGKRNNRRIEIVVVPDLSTLPGYDELRKLGQSGGDTEDGMSEEGVVGGQPG